MALCAPEAFFHVQDLVIEPAAGGYVVGWSSQTVAQAPFWGHLQRLGSAGELAGARADLVPGGGGEAQRRISIVPLPDGTLSAVWNQRSPYYPFTYSIYTRHFDAGLHGLTAPTQLADTLQASDFAVSAAPIGANIGLSWAGTTQSGQSEVRTAVIAPEASVAGPFDTAAATYQVSDVRVLPSGAGPFGVLWQEVRGYSRGTNAYLHLQHHSATGAATDAQTELNGRAVYWVSELTGEYVQAGQGIAVAGPDGHLVVTYQSADQTQPNQYLFGR
ncbi:hypothetical protein [Ramlibacter humi]|uniref:Uncharacterized protein n=1 Tax=Ramlibacter humi TaxID=2530451 RepID=A0A4Z0BNS0_9BURK|nr:hypothetical protein [Ramlibacter humi]TFZ00070.1 hypothetical protein EZ216_13240 [Ramlibacter humi]